MKRFAIFLIVSASLSCKATKNRGAEKPAAGKQQPKAATVPAGPLVCKTEAIVVKILPAYDPDKNSICARYPCTVKVRVLKVADCGSSAISMPLVGDTIEVRFANTILKTERILPDLKPGYPGLRLGAVFTANMESHIKPMDKTEYLVYDYALK